MRRKGKPLKQINYLEDETYTQLISSENENYSPEKTPKPVTRKKRTKGDQLRSIVEQAEKYAGDILVKTEQEIVQKKGKKTKKIDVK